MNRLTLFLFVCWVPLATECQSSPIQQESYPACQILTFEFAAKGNRPALKAYWYDGGKMPPMPTDLGDGIDMGDNGIYFVGDKGTMFCGGWSGAPKLFPDNRRQEFSRPPKSIARSPGHRGVGSSLQRQEA